MYTTRPRLDTLFTPKSTQQSPFGFHAHPHVYAHAVFKERVLHANSPKYAVFACTPGFAIHHTVRTHNTHELDLLSHLSHAGYQIIWNRVPTHLNSHSFTHTHKFTHTLSLTHSHKTHHILMNRKQETGWRPIREICTHISAQGCRCIRSHNA